MNLKKHDMEDLAYAKMLLENPSLAVKLTNYLGTPIEQGFRMLPQRWFEKVSDATRIALFKSLHTALSTMKDHPSISSSETMHKFFVAATGAVGGAMGLPALTVELPISTTLMLRSIADIARSEGERISTPETQLACIEVFALGGRSERDDAAEIAYFQVRAALAKAVSEAAEYIVQRGIVEESAPVIVRLISQIAARFGTTVSEKVAAQAIPLIGAAGGLFVNLIFMDHFQDMARGHFIVRRLERKYGTEQIEEIYRTIS